LEANYNDKLGKEVNSVRLKVASWDAGCPTCIIKQGYDKIIDDGNNILTQCGNAANTASDYYYSMMRFATAYLIAAFRLFTLSGSVYGVFKAATGCEQDLMASTCPYRFHVTSLATKIQQVTSKAFYLTQVLQFMDEDCATEAINGWPFQQSCRKNGDCNFGYMLAISNTQYNNRLNLLGSNVAVFLDKSYYKKSSIKECEKFTNQWRSLGFGSQGLFSYYDTNKNQKLVDGNCPAIVDHANQAGYIDLLAIRNFCIPLKYEKCKQEIKFNELWGFDLS